ncbi:MAG: Ig-like domain-containing protein [Treponema sp.]|jgi:hypothetical protein|nr:Ig-like domain-containing protein [Treponema sp.]
MKKNIRSAAALLLLQLFITTLLANCTFEDKIEKFIKEKKARHVQSVSISGKSSGIIGVGQPFTLSAEILPENAKNMELAWSSSDNEIAWVTPMDDNPLLAVVEGRRAGEVTITVTTDDGGKTDSRSYTVASPVYVTGITLNKDLLHIRIRTDGTGGTSTIVNAVITPVNATNKDVVWKIADESVAAFTLSNNGLTATVTAKSIGTTIITVTALDGDWEATADIVVKERGDYEIEVESVTIDAHDALWLIPPSYILTGEDESLWEYIAITATVDPSYADYPELIWEVNTTAAGNDPSAKVVEYTVSTDTKKLTLRAFGPGTVSIKAAAESYPDISATSTLRLKIPAEQVMPDGMVMVLTEASAVQTAGSRFNPTYCEADVVSDWNWTITNTNIATLTGGNTASPTVYAKTVGTTKLNVSVKVDGETITGDVDLVVRNPAGSLDKDFLITFSDGYAPVAVAPAGIVRGKFTNEVPGRLGEEVLMGNYGRMYPDTTDLSVGWVIDLNFKAPIEPELITQYKGVRIKWGHSVMPDGTVMDACGFFAVRIKTQPGMLILDIGQGRGLGVGWYQPSGGIPLGVPLSWDFVAQNTGWAGGNINTGATGMMIQLADSLCFFDKGWDGNTKFPAEYFYVYSIEFYK